MKKIIYLLFGLLMATQIWADENVVKITKENVGDITNILESLSSGAVVSFAEELVGQEINIGDPYIDRSFSIKGNGVTLKGNPMLVGLDNDIVFENIKFKESSITIADPLQLTCVNCSFEEANEYDRISITPSDGKAVLKCEGCTFISKDRLSSIFIQRG